MLSVVSNVQYNTIAREWRCKWDSDESLIESQNALSDVLDKVKSVDGVRDVQRVVCGGCKDFKVIVSLDASTFAEWETTSYAPELEFLAKLRQISGVSSVETQTYTLMSMMN